MMVASSRAGSRGQATVEFVFVSLMLILLLMLGWQVAWVGAQKWYFNQTAAYAARAWSVYPMGDYTPNEILLKVEALAFIRTPKLFDIPLVKIMTANDANSMVGDSDSDNRFGTGNLPAGIRYQGLGFYFGWFRPATLASAGFQPGSPGTIVFETYIPIEHEETFNGRENPNRYDNDRNF